MFYSELSLLLFTALQKSEPDSADSLCHMLYDGKEGGNESKRNFYLQQLAQNEVVE